MTVLCLACLSPLLRDIHAERYRQFSQLMGAEKRQVQAGRKLKVDVEIG